MTNLSSRAARIFAHPILKANPCNEIRCQQGPVKGAANLCASRHRHIYSTEGNALAARRTAKGFFHLILKVTSSSPLVNKKKPTFGIPRDLYSETAHPCHTLQPPFGQTGDTEIDSPFIKSGPDRCIPCPEGKPFCAGLIAVQIVRI